MAKKPLRLIKCFNILIIPHSHTENAFLLITYHQVADYTHTLIYSSHLFPAHPRFLLLLPLSPSISNPLERATSAKRLEKGKTLRRQLKVTLPRIHLPPSTKCSFPPFFLPHLPSELRPPFLCAVPFSAHAPVHIALDDTQPCNRGTSVYAREKVDENSRASQQPFVAGSRLFERYFRRRGVFTLHPVQINGANSI